MIEKWTPDLLTLSITFYKCLSLVKSLLEGRHLPIWEKREPTHMRLSGTDRLIVETKILKILKQTWSRGLCGKLYVQFIASSVVRTGQVETLVKVTFIPVTVK